MFILCPFLLASGCGPAGAVTRDAKAAPGAVQVLFIGNSYVYYNDLPPMLARLAASAGHEVRAEMVAKGGWTLEQHVASDETTGKIASRAWDYVILQEQSVIPSIPAEREAKMYPAARALHTQIAARGAQTVLMITWGRQKGLPKVGFAARGVQAVLRMIWGRQKGLPRVEFADYGGMQAQLATGYETIGAELGAVVAPVGLAWQKAVAKQPDVALWDPDGSHPAAPGSYLAVCVLYATLFGENPQGLSYHADLPPDEARFLQAVAAETVAARR